ncbi:MAG TPA: helix-turn-helix transcriptional regulator [Thermoanaerobaculia bacterium]|nr:helix-turn-helix transcriptional regulator [Thermoanaerobaculia bacterium]
MRPEFGDLLRDYRVDAEVTLTSLAHHLELKVPYLSDVERGIRPPLNRSRILAAAKFLGRPAELLLTAAARHSGVIPDTDFSPETEVAIGTFLLHIETITPLQWQRIAGIAGVPSESDAGREGEVVPMRHNERLKKARGNLRARANPDVEVSHDARSPARQKAAGRRD